MREEADDVVPLALGFAAAFILLRKKVPGALPAAYAVLGALALQLTIGISMVLKTFPLLLTTAHTAGAALHPTYHACAAASGEHWKTTTRHRNCACTRRWLRGSLSR